MRRARARRGSSRAAVAGERVAAHELDRWLAPPRRAVAWTRRERILAYVWWTADRLFALPAALLLGACGSLLLGALVEMTGRSDLHQGTDLLWLGLALLLLVLPVVGVLGALGLSRHWSSSPAAAAAEANPKPPPDLFVQADRHGLRLGLLWRRRVPWWQIERVTRRGSEWTIDWRGGTVVLAADEPRNAGLRRALHGVMRARARGQLLPGEPLPDRIPSSALSLAEPGGADVSGERALSRVDAEA